MRDKPHFIINQKVKVMKAIDFKEFIKAGKKVVKRSSFPILDNILFKDGYAIVSDFNVEIKKYFGIEGSFLIDFKEFEKITSKLKNSKINFVLHGDEIKMETEKGNFTFLNDTKAIENDDFPLLEKEFSEKENLFRSDIEKIKKAKFYCSTDELRPSMCNVFLDKKNIVATDAHIVSFDVSHERKNTFLMPKKVIEILEEEAAKVSFCKEEYSRYIFIEQQNGIEIKFLEEENIFPQWKTVIPSETGIHAKLAAKELIEILELAAFSTPESGLVKLNFKHEVEKLRISSTDLDYHKNYEGKMNCIINENIEIGVKNDFLMKIIKNEKMQTINLKFQNANRAMIINENLILMPMVP